MSKVHREALPAFEASRPACWARKNGHAVTSMKSENIEREYRQKILKEVIEERKRKSRALEKKN